MGWSERRLGRARRGNGELGGGGGGGLDPKKKRGGGGESGNPRGREGEGRVRGGGAVARPLQSAGERAPRRGGGGPPTQGRPDRGGDAGVVKGCGGRWGSRRARVVGGPGGGRGGAGGGGSGASRSVGQHQPRRARKGGGGGEAATGRRRRSGGDGAARQRSRRGGERRGREGGRLEGASPRLALSPVPPRPPRPRLAATAGPLKRRGSRRRREAGRRGRPWPQGRRRWGVVGGGGRGSGRAQVPCHAPLPRCAPQRQRRGRRSPSTIGTRWCRGVGCGVWWGWWLGKRARAAGGRRRWG